MMTRQKRRIDTEHRLLDAAWALVVERGVAALGVNAVATRAGVDKVLIYRYFGGLEGLLERCGEHADFWPSTDELLGGAGRPTLALPPREAAEALTLRYIEALRSRPATLAVLRSECVARSPLTAALEEVRERRSLALMQVLAEAGLLTTDEQRTRFALFGAAIHYLLVRGPGLGEFSGVDVGTEAGWRHLVGVMVGAVLVDPPA